MIVPWHVLENAARAIGERALAPRSALRFGCALVSKSGRIYMGVNWEVPGGGLHAEATAVGAGVTGEGSDFRIVKLCVVNHDDGGLRAPSCGACRQLIAAFSDEETEIGYQGGGGMLTIHTVRELLPDAYGWG